MVLANTDANEKMKEKIFKFEAAEIVFERRRLFFGGLGIVTAVSVVCGWYESYAADGRGNESICAYVGDVRVANNLTRECITWSKMYGINLDVWMAQWKGASWSYGIYIIELRQGRKHNLIKDTMEP